MMLKDVFARPIDRDITGVIKVSQSDDENIKQELEEYVVTRELQKHLADFLASYKKGMNSYTDKMGVWISGFFGSGKSHFLKILAYILENRVVNGKKAIDYFIDDNKIADTMVLADMKLVANRSAYTDVMLFNIDSKSELTGKQSKDAIVSVFLKVFNEMQGFCGSMPYIADFERQLVSEGRYAEFKNAFIKTYGQEWDNSRHKFDFIQDHVVDVINKIGFMSEAAARNWCEKASEPYNISIESFARMVKEYIERKGANNRVVFLVDEMGQYIGDDSKLMLNLQTVTEDLGTACRGKAWVIVTSQQDIDSITKGMDQRGSDFSKIQGRFDTRLSFSSANVDEVIKKRVLEKTQTAEQTLKLLYEQKSTIIKNLVVFNDRVEKKLYANEKDFASVYPFVPYQFNLLAAVLTSIRIHGASGKHLSEGERSMLALFKESAMKFKFEEIGLLIPFNVYYDALHQFLDHSHKAVISKALLNDHINVDNDEECFNVNVLKTLFMIKYVKEITANIENITSLMIDNIDTDRIQLKKKVEEALRILVNQMLVQRNGDIFVFLTNEEQEINREIDGQNVEMAEVIGKVSELIFEDLYSDKKYQYSALNGRYSFYFNQMVDDRPYKSGKVHDIGVRVLTPYYDYGNDETNLRLMSGQGKDVLIVMKNDQSFLNELRIVLKIEKYLRLTNSAALTKYEQIKTAKRNEMKDRYNNAKIFLFDALKSAEIYVNGDKAQIASKEIKARINDALGRLVSVIYHKLGYIDVPVSLENIKGLFRDSKQHILETDDGRAPNVNALGDMFNFIALQSKVHAKTSMKSLMDRFMKAPYGFLEDDVEWLVAKLFKDGNIALSINNASVTLLNRSEDEIVKYITKKEFIERLMVELREKANHSQKKSVREVMKELFGVSSVNDDDDAIMSSFQSYGKELLNDIEKIEIMQKEDAFPGKGIIANGKSLLRTVTQIQSSWDFFRKIHDERRDYFDFAEELESVKAFYKGEQKKIFDKALKHMAIFAESKNYIVDQQLEDIVDKITAILQKDKPYADIPKLPELLEQFNESYSKALDIAEAPVLTSVEEAKKRVFEALDGKEYKEELSLKFSKQFKDIHDKATTCNNLAKLNSFIKEADTLKLRLLNEISRKDEQIAEHKAQILNEKMDDFDASGKSAAEISKPIIKKHKNISIKTIAANTWRIESAQDAEKHISELRAKILVELEEDIIVNIEF